MTIDREQYRNTAEVLDETGLSPRALKRRLMKRSVPTYTDPIDLRRRLIHIDDIPKLIAIQPRERRAS